MILKKIAESLELQRVYTNMKNLSPQELNKNSAVAKYEGTCTNVEKRSKSICSKNDLKNPVDSCGISLDE